MKRIYRAKRVICAVIISLLSLSAMSISAEEVGLIGGFRLGAVLPDDVSSQAVEQRALTNFSDRRVTREYKVPQEGFFDFVYLRVNEDERLVGLIFSHEYRINRENIKVVKERIKRDFQDFYHSLVARWGVPIKEQSELLLSRYASSDLSFLNELQHQEVVIVPDDPLLKKIVLRTYTDESTRGYVRGWDKEAQFFIAYLTEEALRDEIEQRGELLLEDKTEGY